MDAPRYKEYYSDPIRMSRAQQGFYDHLHKELDRGKSPSVDGQISYLFTYTYEVLAQWESLSVHEVYERLVSLSERYHYETKFSDYCLFWAGDCLLARGEYEAFLVLSEPDTPFAASTHHSNLRCNVSRHLNRSPAAIDLVRMSGRHVTSYTRRHAVQFIDLLEHQLQQQSTEDGPWLDRLLSAGSSDRYDYSHSLFQGAPIAKPELAIPFYCYYTGVKILEEPIRAAENELRDNHGVARVGEGWVSETALLGAIRAAFPDTRVLHHGRPAWLGRQHFDIWLPHWRIAVEYHGSQHFGGLKGLAATQKRDQHKAKLCRKHGAHLLIATAEFESSEVVRQIHRLMPWQQST